MVETARHVLNYTGGTLLMPMTVLVEQYWREIRSGLAQHAIPVRHFVLYADQDTLRKRIEGDTVLAPPRCEVRGVDDLGLAVQPRAGRFGVGREVLETGGQSALQIAEAVTR